MRCILFDTANKIRSGRLSEVDFENVAEGIESLGSQNGSAINRTSVITIMPDTTGFAVRVH